MARELPGSKKQLDQLRTTMLEQGCTFEQIAAVFAQQWGFRRRQAWRNAYGWTQEQVADRYNQLLDNGQAPMTGKRIGDYENWPDSPVKPNLKVLHMLAKIYSTSTHKLVDPYDRQKMRADELIHLDAFGSSSPIPTNVNTPSSDVIDRYRSPLGNFPSPVVTPIHALRSSSNGALSSSIRQESPWSIRESVESAAGQSKEHSENAQGSIMPEATLDEITTEVERLTKEHLYGDPLNVFRDIIRTRDRIYRLLEQRQYPHQTAHLYYLVGIVCFLLADISVNVGFPRAAVEQAQASWTYAEIINHNSLRLQSRRMQAGVAYWENRPQRALGLALSATDWATEPLARAAIHSAIALFSALTARPREARVALAVAFEAHESSTGNSELHDHLGGVFSYSRAKLLQDSATTYFELGDLNYAERSAVEAVQLYESGPAELRAFGSEALARIDLGHARLIQGDAEGAEEALRRVLELPPSQRLDSVGARLKNFHTQLRSHRIATSPLGRQLAQQIEDFFDATAAHNFPRADE